jgi:membrane protease YdiL (CAAX protease family)
VIKDQPPVDSTGAAEPVQPPSEEKPISLAAAFLIPFFMLIIPGSFVVAFFMVAESSLRHAVTITQIGAVIVPTLLLYRHYNRSVLKMTAPQVPSPLPLAGLLIFLSGLVLFGDTFMYLVTLIVPEVIADYFWQMIHLQAELMEIHTVLDFIWYMAIVVLGAGIFEELLFRGLILQASLRHVPPLPAVLLNGLLFAVMHQNAIAGLYYFILGAVLAWAAIRTGTLIYGMIIHGTLNFGAWLLHLQFGDLVHFPIPAPVALLLGAAIVALGIWLFQATEKKNLVTLFPKPAAPDGESIG